MRIRNPAVAGKFYPKDKKSLCSLLSEYLILTEEKLPAKGVIVPHAGYIYSGRTAAMVYSKVNIPETVLLLCPDHYGFGSFPASLSACDSWLSPLGEIPVNKELSSAINHTLKCFCEYDDAPHQYEHSIEVHLPFLKYINSDVSIVPISLSLRSIDEIVVFADALTIVINESASEVLIVASSDMTHYESFESAKKKDGEAIDKILSLDPNGLLDVCANNKITMCGVVPAAAMLMAAIKLNASKAELIHYSTSGEFSGDYSQVVGYAGIAVS